MFVSMLASEKFYEFLDNSLHPESDPDFDYHDHLADYIFAWLAYGHGASECSNDHRIFMMAVVLITNNWSQKPNTISWLASDTKEESRLGSPPSKVLNTNCRVCQLVFDPQFFTQMAHDPEYYNRIHAKADGVHSDKS